MNRLATACILAASAVLGAPALLAQQTEVVSWSSGVTYTYDGAGNVASIGNDEFVYDDVGRLVQAEVNGAKRNYTYDQFGNRTGCTHNTSSDCLFAWSVSTSNNRIEGPARYDNRGNAETLGSRTYSYDALNMMTSDGASAFIYTADDERLAIYRLAEGTWDWTLRGMDKRVLRVFTSHDEGNTFGKARWSWKKDYVWRENLLLASRQLENETVTTYHYHLDHLGTPRRITDQKDLTVGFHDYFAFGPEISGGKQEPSRTELKFTAHERDLLTDQYSLDYMHARFYNPAAGRFLSVDPARSANPALPQSWNRYAYALNNPLRYFDPNGLQTMDYRILHVRVNIVYSNADQQGMWMSRTLRERTEAGIQSARHYFGQMGIALTFHRYEGGGIDKSTYDRNDPNAKLLGFVRTDSGDVSLTSFVEANRGRSLNIFVSGDLRLEGSHGGTGFIGGVPAFSVLPRNSDAGTLPHEIAHALGNTLGNPDRPAPGTNGLTDFIWFMERQQYNMGIGFSMTFEKWMREGAEKLNNK